MRRCCAVAALLLALAGKAAAAAAADSPAQVVAFYYCWYGDPQHDGEYKHWNHEVLPHWDAAQRDNFEHGTRFEPPQHVHSPFYPLKGPYSSIDPAVVGAHIAEMVNSNITVMAVSWWGPAWRAGTHDTQGVNTDAVLQTLVREVERQPTLKLAFHLEPYEGRTVATVREDLQHLMQAHGDSDALLRIDGRPVHFVYDSYRIPAGSWAKLLTPKGEMSVRNKWPLDGVFIALMLELSDGPAIIDGGWDGVYTYFASDAVSGASKPTSWPGIARWAEEHGLLFVASLGPGYDDSRIRPWNAGATRPRDDGARYSHAWEAAAASGAHSVSITSFNEWGEGTQIEPARPAADGFQDYGPGGPHLYLDLTRRHASAFLQARAAARERGAGGGGGSQAIAGEGAGEGEGAGAAAPGAGPEAGAGEVGGPRSEL